ncbi:pseudouridine synthase [Puia sp.]|uniref:pseudouridine synthase n=1 Tax=Puia sp. TaxID=2045100 RepID=UPI002F41864B
MKRKTDNFSKFYNKKNNAAIKEAFRQEKKTAKRERKEAIEKHFEEKRKARFGEPQQPQRPVRGGKPAFGAKAAPGAKAGPGKQVPMANAAPGKPSPTAKAAPGASTAQGRFTPTKAGPGKLAHGAPTAPGAKPASGAKPATGAPAHHGEQLPLNKYIAHSGVCSRRDAADLIKLGKVTVNGKPVTEPGTKVLPTDTVKVNGKQVTISRNFVYVLLNKPKDYITTTDDPQGRKTVLDLIRQATPERVFPIGRLDRNTSGVLLLTNDGDLAQKLAHPSHEIKKIYHVVLDKPLTKADFDKIIGGIILEDGPALVDVLAYADPKDKTQIGLEIHSGRNRIVRRIFEYLGYDVRGLDRVMYAGLTKKNVQRGHWRLLNEKEIRILKYLNSSFKGSLAPKRTAESAAAKRSDAAAAAAKGPNAASGATPQLRAMATAQPSAKAKPARSIPPKGQKPAKPTKGRKPYNPKSPRPEKE